MENKNKEYKIYGMLLEVRDTFFLSIQYAISLEEAFSQAKLEFLRLNPPTSSIENSLMGSKISLFTIKNIDQVIHEHKVFNNRQLEKIVLKQKKIEMKENKKKVEIKKIQITQEEIKNMIMKEIVIKKDKNLLKQHKELFNENEKKYLTEKIENKTN